MKPEDWIELGLTPRAKLTFAAILSRALDVRTLRQLAKKHGTKPKGFRVEKANATQLADALAEDFVHAEALRTDLADALVAAITDDSSERPAQPQSNTASAEVDRLVVENERLQATITKLEQTATRATRTRDEALRERGDIESERDELRARLTMLERDLERERAEHAATRSADSADSVPTQDPAAGRDLEELRERERAQRLRIAELSSRTRALETEVQELVDLLPRGERERRRKQRKSYEESAPVVSILPRFEDEFFRTLEDLAPMDQRKVFTAVARLVLHGPEYPGLHKKMLKGMGGLTSIRAADALRIYFRRVGDEVFLEACGQREQQDAFLKRRK